MSHQKKDPKSKSDFRRDLKPIKIVIAEDHNLVRQSFALALETDKAFKVVDQAENGKDLLKILEKKRPDVVLLDLEMPVMSGWEALDLIKARYPDIKVVIVSMYFEGLIVKDLVAKGARGFLPKNSDFPTLLSAIHEVHQLGYFFSQKINRRIINDLLSAKAIEPSFVSSVLNKREVKTLRLICEDKLNKEIAEKLKVSERTLERYRTGLYRKTQARTQAGLVLYALKHKIIVVPK